jgi:hypothetical protein
VVQKEYDESKIPDLIELRKQLSEVNKQRHKFWDQLRAIRNQIWRYMEAHKIGAEEFDEPAEWEMGREIPLGELKQLFGICDLLFVTSGHEEELRRQVKLKLQDDFFLGPTCLNCQLPLTTDKQTKFCSKSCADQYRKKKYKRKKDEQVRTDQKEEMRSKKQTTNAMVGPNPQQGEGKRNLECNHYSHCLDEVLNWESFNCEGCNLKVQ